MSQVYLPPLTPQCYVELRSQVASKFTPSDIHLVQAALTGLGVHQTSRCTKSRSKHPARSPAVSQAGRGASSTDLRSLSW